MKKSKIIDITIEESEKEDDEDNDKKKLLVVISIMSRITRSDKVAKKISSKKKCY